MGGGETLACGTQLNLSNSADNSTITEESPNYLKTDKKKEGRNMVLKSYNRNGVLRERSNKQGIEVPREQSILPTP